MANPLKIGVVGVGFGATVHIPAFQSEGLEVVAVCARRLERAQAAALQFGVEHALDDYAAMLALPGLDAVSIVTPAATHRDMALAAFAAGKHVICEKPFALNSAEAREMWRAGEDRGLTAMTAFEFRFTAGRALVKELLDSGYVGTPQLARANMVLGPAAADPDRPPPDYSAERDDAGRGAGMLGALGSHYLDGLAAWFGEAASVGATLVNFSPDRLRDGAIVKSQADTTYLLDVAYRNGVIAQVMGTMAAPFGVGAQVEVYGDRGALVTPQGTGWNPPAAGEVLGARLGDPGLRPIPVPPRLAPFEDDRDHRLMAFRLLVREFVRGVESGTSPSPNFLDGYRSQKLLDAARQSHATGRRVEIAPD